MKIIKTSTYDRLVANQRNFDLLTERHDKLEKEFKAQSERNDHLKAEVRRISDKLAETERQLSKYRPRRGYGGKFEKKTN